MARNPDWARDALHAYVAVNTGDTSKRDDPYMAEWIVALMSDLMHFAVENKLHPAVVTGQAEQRFVAEHQAHVEAEHAKEAARVDG
jgi:hypothetical protein